MKVMSVVGARPQFIKLGPLSRAIRVHCEEIVVHTGQHFDSDMSATFFKELDLPTPDYDLNVGSGSHAVQTAAMLERLEVVMLTCTPNAVIVFGDTNTTLAAALAAAKLHIPVVHVEAGLRSFNRTMPEEINRIVVDRCSDLLFAPTEAAYAQLVSEGLGEVSVLTGDIMADALRENAKRALQRSSVLERLGVEEGSYILLTLHRPYTVDDARTLAHVLEQMSQVGLNVLFPVHPRTRTMIDEHTIPVGSSVRCVPPQGYLDFIRIMNGASAIVTDSGGIQKEAYLLGRPCVTIRTETEWIETVEAGWNLLVDPQSPDISRQIQAFKPAGSRPDVYGRSVADKMVKHLLKLTMRS